MSSKDKHSSLFCLSNNDKDKKYYWLQLPKEGQQDAGLTKDYTTSRCQRQLNLLSSSSTEKAQCLKIIYVCDLRMFVIKLVFVPAMSFQPGLISELRPEPTEVNHLSGASLRAYMQT
jgi:hypothetical protein